MAEFQPYVQEYWLFSEYKLLSQAKIPGVYVLPRRDSLFLWDGVIFLRQGYYNQGIFRFQLEIPQDFPGKDIPVYHPMVDFKTGELDVRRKFSEWRGAPKDYLWHVVAYIRRVFYKIETCNPCNPEAARLFESDPDMFKVHLQECLRKADTELYNHEESCIEFSRWKHELHDAARRRMLGETTPAAADKAELSIGDSNAQFSGLSWLK